MASKMKRFDRKAPLTIEEAQSKTQDVRKKKCRYCTNEKTIRRFYPSQDFLDTDGRMSICIDCVSYLFNYYYSVHSRIDIAIYEVCRCLNVRYDSRAYSSLIKALERNGMQATVDAINGDYDESSETDIDKRFIEIADNVFNDIPVIVVPSVVRSKWKKVFEIKGYICQICGYSDIVEIHHKNRSLGNTIENLMVLCPNCHRKVHAGMINISN